MYEAMVTTTWIASHTQRLRVGSLVLCDSFRHPAMLAREAVSIDHASGGRFDLGIGWGSVAEELSTFGVGPIDPSIRVARMKETLEIVTALWAGETVDHKGEYFVLENASQAPRPLHHIPIVIGGAGRKTMQLVAAYADWWNVHVGIVDRLETMRPLAGNARVSLQLQVAFVHSEADRAEVTETARPPVRAIGAGGRHRPRAHRSLRTPRCTRGGAGLRLVLRLRATPHHRSVRPGGHRPLARSPCTF